MVGWSHKVYISGWNMFLVVSSGFIADTRILLQVFERTGAYEGGHCTIVVYIWCGNWMVGII